MKPIALIGAVLLAASLTQPATAASPGIPVTADLDGRPIAASQVGSFYCHDRDYPAIHCYSTPAGLESARAATYATPAPAATQGSSDYVVVYSGPSYTGNYFYVSQNYDMLALGDRRQAGSP